MSDPNVSRRMASAEQSDTGSVRRRPSRFADYSSTIPRWNSANDVLRAPHNPTAITEETEFTGMSCQYDGTRTSELLGRTRTTTLPRQTRFQKHTLSAPSNPRAATAAPSNNPAKPTNITAGLHDITETSHITINSSIGPDGTNNSIRITKRSDPDHDGVATTTNWLFSRRHDAIGEMRQRLEKLGASRPADLTRTSVGKTRPLRAPSSRFRQIVNVPVPPEEDEIYGALQRIEERLEALEEVTGTHHFAADADADAQPDGAEEANNTELSRVEAPADDDNITLLSPFSTRELEDLRRQIEEEHKAKRGGRRRLASANAGAATGTEAVAKAGTSAGVGTAAGAGIEIGVGTVAGIVNATGGVGIAAGAGPAAGAGTGTAAPRSADKPSEAATVRLARLVKSVEAEHSDLCAELAVASDELVGWSPSRAEEPGLAIAAERVRRLAALVAAKKKQLRLAH